MIGLEIFERSSGLEFLTRWGHVIAGVAWIGLLYYFNFVQVPSFAQMEAGARSNAIDKLASRALWWFRWSSVATVLLGFLILLVQPGTGTSNLTSSDYIKSEQGVSIYTGVLLGLVMFVNVWAIIWRNQKKVIANARGESVDGDPAAAGRAALLASRQNTMFSIPMLAFMIATGHFIPQAGVYDTSDNRAIYWIVTVVIIGVLELNALGIIGGKAQNFTNWVYEDHRRTIVAGFLLAVIWYVLWELLFN